MTLPNESGHDDQQLVRYLLGLLPDEEQERVDEMSVVDDAVAGRLRVVEHDLVDAYVSGCLAGETLERFESFYLASPRRREKVRFARGFLRSVDRAAPPVDIDTGRGANRSLGTGQPVAAPAAPWHARIVPRPGQSWILAAIAALLFLSSAALLFEDARLRQGLSGAQTERAALGRRAEELEQQLKDQQTAGRDVVRQLEQARASLAANAQSSTVAKAPGSVPSAARGLAALAVVLLPQTRAAGPIATLDVPPSADRVAFDLRLEANDFPRYRVALKDPGTNHIVWRSHAIIPRSGGDEATVSVIVPASVLKPQHYSLELDGLGVAGGEDVVGSYIVRITRP